MSRYIDADKIKQRFVKMYWQNEEKQGVYDPYVKAIEKCVDILDKQPTADVQEIQHGKWLFETRECLDTVDNNGEFLRRLKPVYKEIRTCSVCNACFANTNKIVMGYCPHCGAKMDGE